MGTITPLLWADLIGFRRWFSSQSVSKFVVFAAFVVVFGGVAWVLYGISSIFFRALAGFEEYGIITASYLIHASVLVVLWLAIGSSIASSVGLLLSPSRNLAYLVALPVRSSRITSWLFLKSAVASTALMAVVFVPIMSAYARAFDVASFGFIVRILFVLFVIIIISGSIGSLVAYLTAARMKGREYVWAIIGISLFFAVMIALLRFIFPPTLARLSDVTAEEFSGVYASLPLVKYWLPTVWFLETVIVGFGSHSIMAFIAAVVCVGLSLRYQSEQLLLRFQSARAQPYRDAAVSPVSAERLKRVKFPFLYKDWLSISRMPSETGYALFLTSIAVFFFAFLSFGVSWQLRAASWQTELTVFSFAWIMFFATAYLLRIAFPLMAREGIASWFIFALPVVRSRLLWSKIALAVFLSVPIMVFSVVVWQILPFTVGNRMLLSAVTLVGIVSLAVSLVLIGAIAPNFREGNDPEKVSTSGMGLVALAVASLLTAGVCDLFLKHFNGALAASFVFLSAAIFVLLLLVLSVAARASVGKYQFP